MGERAETLRALGTWEHRAWLDLLFICGRGRREGRKEGRRGWAGERRSWDQITFEATCYFA